MTPRLFVTTCALGALAACSPLRQPLGSLMPRGGAAGASSTGGASGLGGSAGAGTLTGNQVPSLTPEWTDCDPMVFRCFVDPTVSSLSSQASALFGGTPDPTSKPTIVYPLDGAMHPINLADITFQWRLAPDAAQTVFRIRLKRQNGDVFEFFVPCNHTGLPSASAMECAYAMPPGAWIDAATTARGEALTVEIAGVDAKQPTTFATSDPIALSFSPEDVRGGLYYWSSDITGTRRLLFGARASDAYIKHDATTTTSCGGCHAVSRDGSTIAFEQGNTGGVLWVASTADAATPLFTPSTTHDAGTQAVNHDGTRVLVSYSGRLLLRDAHTGATLAEVDETLLGTTMHAFHPEWSPDDQRVAVTVSNTGDSDWAVRTGSIGVLPYNGGAFGKVDILVPTGTTAGSTFNFYPTWSPDGHYLAFATGTVGAPPAMPAQQTSYDQATARLRLVNVDTRVVTDLAAASGPAGRTSTWPKFAPFSQAGGLMVLTFNAKLDYGFFLPNNAAGSPQLWLTFIDPSKLAAGADPSTAPVWLPFQGVTQRNYAGAWTEAVGCRVEGGQSVGCGDHQICNAGACAMVAP